jgi:hypothetical protein
MSIVDIARSIVLGQGIVIIAFAILNVFLTITLQCPQPGRMIAVISTTTSYVLAVAYVMMHTLERLGQSPTPKIWLAVIITFSGTLGVSLHIANLVFHSAKGLKLVQSWFGKHE